MASRRGPGRAVALLAAAGLGLLLALAGPLPADAGADHCYTDLGCFPLGPEFYDARHRPFNVRPWHRRHIGTQFEVFSARAPGGRVLRAWNLASLARAHFDPRLETKVIVPGWLDNVERAVWVRQLRDALLWLWRPANVLVVRWRNFTPYTIATANTRVVGAELAELVRFLERALAYDRAHFHLIGHSLGAHIAGYCGARLPGLGRITALDPARPFFQGMPAAVRLDRADASFVDAIHSDFTPENALLLLMSFGMTTPLGHVDFYPNGPALLQPGCLRDTLASLRRGLVSGLRYGSLSVAFLDAARYLTACDHQRSHEWFLESLLNRRCLFVGLRCDTYEGLISGRCTCDDAPDACAIMGIHADQLHLSGARDLARPAPRPASRLVAEAVPAGPAPAPVPLAGPLDDAPLAAYLLEAGRAPARRRLDPDWPGGALENWYEHSNRWYLKTNNRPNYCANQYQVLVFLGPLGTRAGPDGQLRANLVLSIVGSRGQLLNQRFVPGSAKLSAYTMQPFFVLLEGAYSLGQIRSVAVAWEARRQPDPVQATVSFQDNRLAAVQTHLPALKAKHPWLSKTLQYDRTRAFQSHQQADTSRQDPTPSSSAPVADSRPSASACARSLGSELGCEQARTASLTRRTEQAEDCEHHLVPAEIDLEPEGLATQLQLTAVPLVPDVGEREQTFLEPLVEPSTPGAWVSDQLAWQDGQVQLELHNVGPASRLTDDEFIVLHRVVVSPLQANYGRAGRNARTFCSPQPGLRLRRDQTIRLEPSIVGLCH